MKGYVLYPAGEIVLGDSIVGLGPVKRIERRIGEIRLYWQLDPPAFIRVGPDTEVLAERPASSYAPSIPQQSQARGVA